jgi:hypothetical protein
MPSVREMRMRTAFTLFALVLALSACSPSVDAFDRVFTDLPRVSTHRTEAKVGEPVEVTLSVNLVVFPQSRIPEARLEDVLLGVCIFSGNGEQEEPGGYGLCHPLRELTSLPSNLTVLDEGAYFLDAGDVILGRGETRTLTHTFTFTSSQPGKVHLLPTLKGTQFYQEGYPSLLFEDGQESVTVTFE